jgi:hypothetical protein
MPLTALGRTTTRMDWAGHMDVSREGAAGHTAERAAAASGMVLLTRASAQFFDDAGQLGHECVDRHVAEDLGTTVTGIQTAITFYILVMAFLMITGGKVGQILGRKRIRHRVRHLRLRVADHRAGTESGGADAGMVGAGRGRGGADHASDRRAARLQLRASSVPRAYGLVASAAAIAVPAGLPS